VPVVQYLLQAGADTQLYNDNNKLAGEEFDLLFEVRAFKDMNRSFHLQQQNLCTVVHAGIVSLTI
jgi:hypothetical protein